MKISSIKQQVKRQDRYSIFVDGKYSFSLSESALLSASLHPEQEITKEQLAELKDTSRLDKAYSGALRWLALRPRSEWELSEYLRRKEIDEDAAAAIAERLRRIGLLDDLAFARAWLQNRRLLKNISRRRLRLELQQKHLAQEIIEQILGEDEADDRQVLRTLIAKKAARYPDQTKLMQYLARQGFQYDDIKTALDDYTSDI